MSNRVAWFDVPVLDLERAMIFYRAVLAVNITEEHPGVAVMEHQQSEVGGCLFVDKEVKPSQNGALLYYDVDRRLDDALTQVKAHGGTVLQDAHPIGEYGKRAIVVDCEGNRLALHSS